MYETGTATSHRDLLEKLHTFLTATGSAFGLTYAGTGNGTMTGYKGGASSVAEVFTITCIDYQNGYFSVTGSVSGALTNAEIDVPYTGALIQFTINTGSTAFADGDTFILNTAPRWTSRRRCRGATVTASSGTSGVYACSNLVDGKTTTFASYEWQAGAAPVWVELTFPAALTIVEYELYGPVITGNAPRDWTFEYHDGSAWAPLDTRSSVTGWLSGQVRTYTISSPVAATRYRLNISAGNSGTSTYLSALRLRTVAAGVDEAVSQYIWEAPGNDGLSAVLVGAHALEREDVDYHDVELCAFSGYDAAVSFNQQPGFHGRLWIPLLNSNIPYWFVADGRRVAIIAKVGAQYESAYMGFLEPYFTPQQVPYPIALGGSLALGGTPYWHNIALRYSNATNQHRAFTHADSNGTGTLYYSGARARRPDGTWVPFFASDSDDFASPNINEGWLWPLSQGMTLLDICPDGSYALFPVVLSDATPNHWGQFAGISVLTGQGLSAETLIRVGAVDWLAVPNITRTDQNDFFAVRLD